MELGALETEIEAQETARIFFFIPRLVLQLYVFLSLQK